MMTSVMSRPSAYNHGWAFGRFGHPAARDSRELATRSFEMLRALTRSRETDVALQITTDDGDTVTLTLHSEQERTAIDYRSSSRGPGGVERARLSYREASSSQDVTIEVQGSLDAEELSDVNALIQRVRATMDDLLRGDPGRAVAALASLDGNSEEFDSLSGFQLDVSRTETVEMVIARLRQWSRPAPGISPLPAAPADPGDGASPALLPLLTDASRQYGPPAALAIE